MSVYRKSFTKEDMQWRGKISSRFKKEHKKHRTSAEKLLLGALKIYFKGISKIVEQKVFYTPKSFVLIDFFLKSFFVGIEVDGGYHSTEEQKMLDEERTKTLSNG
jgi:very-short-patch-repair endonuclease